MTKQQFQDILMRPVDVSSLVLFRILFGFCIFLHAFHYNSPDVILINYSYPDFFFSFSLFHWLHLPLLNDVQFLYLFCIMGVLAYAVMAGFYYRQSLFLLTVSYFYLLLIEKSYMPDPLYLYLLVMVLMLLTNANAAASFDARYRSGQRSSHVPFWQIFILRFQFAVVYVYSGLSKLLNTDFLQAKQLSLWMAPLKETPLIGSLLTQKWMAYLFSYAGMMFDLTIGFLLLNRKTRPLAVVLAVFFHCFNKWMLDLQLVPWFVLVGTVVFFEPETPRVMFEKFLRLFRFKGQHIREKTSPAIPKKTARPGWIVNCIIAYMIVQILIPLRHFLYLGDANWTREGIRFSWFLMNTNFESRLKIQYTPPQKKGCFQLASLNDQQAWWMSGNPEMILQYVHHIRDSLKKCGVESPEVYADSRISLNGREYFPLIDPTVNLSNERYPFLRHASWIMPYPDEQTDPKSVKFNTRKDLRVAKVSGDFVIRMSR